MPASSDTNTAAALRQAAEARLKANPRPRQPLSERELHQLQQELEIRQMELEIQNEKLLQSEASLKRAQAMAHVGNWSFDARSGMVAWSPEMYRIHGVQAETFEPTFSGLSQLIHPDDWPKHLQVHEKGLRGEAVAPFEYRVVRPDGDMRVVMLLAADAQRDDSGQIIRIVGAVQDITARKRAEAELIASEAKYRSLFANMQEGYAYCRMLFEDGQPRDFIYLAVNQAFEQLTGLRDVVGKRVSVVIPGIREADPELFAAYGRVALTGQPERFEICVKALATWFSVSVYGPEKEHFVSVFDVITERKRNELALRESEEKLRQLTETITDVFWIASPDLQQVHYVSPSYERIWGRTVASLYAHSHQWLEAVLPEDRERVARAFASLRASELVVSTEYRIARPNGTVRWILDRGFQVRDAADQVLRVTGVARDITEHKQAEQAVRENERKFSRLFHSSPIAISLSTQQGGRYVDVNEEFLRLVQRTREEVIGRTALELGVWANPGQREALVRQLVEHGSLRNVELGSPLPDGQLRQLLWSAEPVDIGGERCLLNSMLDITERKQAENLAAMSREVLQILNAPGDAKSALQDVLDVMKRRTGFDAVGIRLQAGDDFPYFLQTGFSDHFLRTENSLVSRTVAGGLCRHKDGRVMLECTCGLVLSGQVQPDNPLATPKGSIWTNDSSRLPGLPAAADPRLHPRNECIHQGFASVALVPIRCHTQILGLLQFNDRRKERFNLKLVEQLEEIATHTGFALLRKQAEEALRQSEERYALVEQATNDGLWDWNLLTDEEYLSPRWKEIIGLQDDEIPGHKSEFLKRVHPEDLPRVQAMTAEHLATGRRYEVKFRLRHKDGNYRWVFSRGKAVRDVSGRPVRMVGSTTDITERKEAEEKQARLAAIVESSLDGIISKSPDGIITSWNQGAEKLFGYAAAEVVGTSILRLIPADRQAEEHQILERVSRGENVMHFDTVRQRKGGQFFDASVTASPIRDANGQIIGVSKTIRDISERKRAELRMFQAQKMEAIGTLAGGIAHDFNNMLAAMFGYAHLLQQDTVGNPLAQESVEEILKAANRAKDLVQQILTFSRQREQKPQTMKLDMIIKEVIKFLRASLPAHIKIQKELAAETPAVLADPTQIYQVVMNLATNALHAMEDEPGQLAVRLDPVQPDEQLLQAHPELKPILYARLTVADTGHGMDARTLGRIFEPFFTTKPVGKGTGLGLAVVNGIVAAHNGVITVESQVGQGTTFTLYFPAQTQAQTLTAANPSAVPPGHGQSILAVDDEPALTTVLQKMLGRLDYQITTSNQASEAIRFVRENPTQFDLVITDLTMPEMSGLEVAKQLHAIRPDLPVLLVSGYSAAVTADRLLEAGICERLEKPVSPSVLAAVLARVLRSFPVVPQEQKEISCQQNSRSPKG